MLKTKSENPNGLHLRYIVQKADGTSVDDDAVYFVLRLDRGGSDKMHLQACRVAAIEYAKFVKAHPAAAHLALLGDELQRLVESICNPPFDGDTSQP